MQTLHSDTNTKGQLVLDVYKMPKENEIVVQSTIAGIRPEDLDIFFGNNILTIQGLRHRQENISKENFYYRECYFGNFSRSVKISEKIDQEKISASLKNGILTVKLPIKP